jgi:hypothetical protein
LTLVAIFWEDGVRVDNNFNIFFVSPKRRLC